MAVEKGCHISNTTTPKLKMSTCSRRHAPRTYQAQIAWTLKDCVQQQ
jgi:hypothetical protein